MASTINNTNALNTLKQSFKDIMTTYNLNRKTAKRLVDNSIYRRDLMAEALVAMTDICSKALDMCNPNQDAPSILEDVVSKFKNAIVDIIPSIVTPAFFGIIWDIQKIDLPDFHRNVIPLCSSEISSFFLLGRK